jgi:hypothetical protein
VIKVPQTHVYTPHQRAVLVIVVLQKEQCINLFNVEMKYLDIAGDNLIKYWRWMDYSDMDKVDRL